jgi:toxin YoeB
MKLSMDRDFTEGLQHWIATQPRTAKKVLELVEDVRRHPFEGLGKPEPLKHMGGNTWSRRITQEHRLVYQVDGDAVMLLQCRYHY